jgi:hypothetical protein
MNRYIKSNLEVIKFETFDVWEFNVFCKFFNIEKSRLDEIYRKYNNLDDKDILRYSLEDVLFNKEDLIRKEFQEHISNLLSSKQYFDIEYHENYHSIDGAYISYTLYQLKGKNK